MATVLGLVQQDLNPIRSIIVQKRLFINYNLKGWEQGPGVPDVLVIESYPLTIF